MAQFALKTCEICVSGPGTEYCLECEQYFCENCKSLHTRQKVTKHHEFQRGSNVIQEVKQKCNEHNEELIFVCENCDQPVCLKCVTGKHKGHRVSDVKESISSLKQTISKEISTKLEVIKTNLRQKEQCLQIFDQNVVSVIKQVKEEGAKLKAAIDIYIQKIVESLERKTKPEKEKLEKIISDSKKLLERAKKLDEKEKELQRQREDGALLQKVKNLKREILDLSVAPVPNITSVKFISRSASEKDIVNLLGEYKFGEQESKRDATTDDSMKEWAKYLNKIEEVAKKGEFIGAGVYGHDGTLYATTINMPLVNQLDLRVAVKYVEEGENGPNYGEGLDFAGMKFTFLKAIFDPVSKGYTFLFKRKSRKDEKGNELERVDEKDKYQLFIELSKTVAMVAMFKGGRHAGEHSEAVERMNQLIGYLRSVNT